MFDNVWNPSGQKGEVMLIRPDNQAGHNPWAIVHDVTITNNVVKYCGEGIQIGTNNTTDGTGGPAGMTSLPLYNVLVQNNLLENISHGDTYGDGNAFTLGGSIPGWNIVFDHNTELDTKNGLGLGSGTIPYPMSVVTNGTTCGVKFTNNIVVGGIDDGGAGSGNDALNTGDSGITMFSQGTGYTSAPSITFSAPGGTGTTATGTALIYGVGGIIGLNITTSGSGYTAAPNVQFTGGGGSGAAGNAILGGNGGTGVIGIWMTNYGSGYTSAPTVQFSGGGGSGAFATPILGGGVYGIKMTNNGSGYTAAPTVTFNNNGTGGSGAAVATVSVILDPTDPGYGQVKAWTVVGNVFIGVTAGTNYPAGNYFADTPGYLITKEDSVGFMDPSGDQFNLLSTVNNGVNNPLKGKASDGSDPGVNMAAFAGITDFKQNDATLQNLWKFDDATNQTTATDSKGAKNGTLTSTSLWTTSANTNDGLLLNGEQRICLCGKLQRHLAILLCGMGQSYEHFRHPVHRQHQERFIRVIFLALSQRRHTHCDRDHRIYSRYDLSHRRELVSRRRNLRREQAAPLQERGRGGHGRHGHNHAWKHDALFRRQPGNQLHLQRQDGRGPLLLLRSFVGPDGGYLQRLLPARRLFEPRRRKQHHYRYQQSWVPGNQRRSRGHGRPHLPLVRGQRPVNDVLQPQYL